MGSTNPNRFLPSQWFKVATRKIAQMPPKHASNKIENHVSSVIVEACSNQKKTKLSSQSEELDNPSITNNDLELSKHSSQSISDSLPSQESPTSNLYSNNLSQSSFHKNIKPYTCSPNFVSTHTSNSVSCSNNDNIYSFKRSSSRSMSQFWNQTKSEKSSAPYPEVQQEICTSNGHLGKSDDKHRVQNESKSNNKCLSKTSNNKTVKNGEKLKRNWIKLRPYKPSHVVGTCSVMSYNILSQTLLEMNDFLYRDCDEHVLTWPYRWNNIKGELEKFQMDVLCLQEVEEFHYYESIKPWLDFNGYLHAYKRRTGNDRSKPDGVLTACASHKFEIVATIPVEYYRPHNYLTNWHNVGLILVLKMNGKNENNPYICVGNTHLVYNPKRGDIKLVQLATFFAEIDRVINKFTRELGYKPPLVMCGDFNSTPFSPFYDFVTNGNLTYRELSSRHVSGQKVHRGGRDLPDCLLSDNLKIDDNCKFVEGDETKKRRRSYVMTHDLGPLSSTGHRHREHEATTIQDRGITVDYVFYSDSERPNRSRSSESDNSRSSSIADSNPSESLFPIRYHLKLNERLAPSNACDIEKARGLPNSHHSSDHLPVVASFLLLRSGPLCVEPNL